VLELGWTLNYEMYFYALFALSLLLPLRAGLLMLSVWFVGSVMAGSVTALLPVLRYMTSPMVLEFIAGVAIALLFIQGVIVGTRGRLVLGCLALIWFVAFYAIEPDSRRIIGCGIPAVLLVATMTLAHEQKSRGRTRLKGLLVDLGDCGYSLYLCHMFVIRGATTLLGAFVRGPLSLVFYSLICISATVALARISYRCLEIPLKQALEPCTAAARRPRA
jgi:peptidoglycan/LPS O-acetylase OafA/YrhL